jgi:hypothetical protein
MILDGEVVTDLDDVEIGGLSWLAREHRFARGIVDEAAGLRRLRNRLAHLCSVSIEEAQVVLGPSR